MRDNKMLNNAKWIILCKIIQSVIQLFVGMLSARYLGPSNYGLINYAASIVAFAMPLMRLGLSGILVREYVENPDTEGQILGTSMTMNLVSAIACIIGVTTFTAVADSGETTTILVCVLYSMSLLCQAGEMIQYWFQAKLLSKYSSLAMLGSYIAVSVYKIYLLVAAKSVCWFALSHAVEYGVAALLMMVAYRKNNGQKLSFSLSVAGKMFARSKYYMLSSMMTVAFSSTAGIIMKLVIGAAENGYYSAAVTCAAVVQFVYSAILDSARPVILESKKQDQRQFEKNMSVLSGVILYLALAQSVAFTVFADLIIRILYGADYAASVPVLQILIWQTAFSYMGAIRNIWILAEEKYNRLWIINLCGAISNIILNLCLIPRWGACGAAVASVLTQIIANFGTGFAMKDIRPVNRLMLAGLNPRLMWKTLRELYRNVED